MTNNIEKNEEKKKWSIKNHWKSILAWVSLLLLIVIGYIIVAGVGAPAFGKVGSVKPNFLEPGLALNWYLNNVLIENILGVPAILLSILCFIGYIVLKRGFVDSTIGAIKTAIGVLLLSIGSTALIGIAKPLFEGISKSFDKHVVPLDPYLGWTSGLGFLEKFAKNNYASWVSYSLLIGFAFNLILVSLKRWSNCHAVMTTGHIMFQQSAVVVPFVYILFFRAMPLINGAEIQAGAQVGTIIFSGILLGTYWSVGTTATLKATNTITENANFAIGHQQMLGVSLAYSLGKFFKFTKKDKEVVSAENRKLSKKFRIFEDNIFVQSILIIILFMTLAIILEASGKLQGILSSSSWWGAGALGSFWVIRIIMGSLLAVASIVAIVTGVRMFVTELQQSFQGISDKVIPGSVVAVDIAAVYGFSPNAVTYGFLAGTISQFIAVGVVVLLSLIPNFPIAIAIPLFITLFFNSGAIGVYANIKGGWKASIIIPAIFGFCEIIIISIALGLLQKTLLNPSNVGIPLGFSSPIVNGYNGMIDWNIFFGLPLIFATLHPVVAYVIMPLEIVALLAFVQFVDTGMSNLDSPIIKLIKKVKNKNNLEIEKINT